MFFELLLQRIRVNLLALPEVPLSISEERLVLGAEAQQEKLASIVLKPSTLNPRPQKTINPKPYRFN